MVREDTNLGVGFTNNTGTKNSPIFEQAVIAAPHHATNTFQK